MSDLCIYYIQLVRVVFSLLTWPCIKVTTSVYSDLNTMAKQMTNLTDNMTVDIILAFTIVAVALTTY